MGLGLSLGLRLAGQASPRPSFLAGNEYWGFTASPTPQFAHFGRSTNKAGALASTRNYEAYNLAGTQLFPVNDPVVSAVTGLEGWAAVTNLLLNSDAPSGVNRATLTANAAIAPDGTMTAAKLEEDATAGGHFASDNAATVNGTTYNRSVFLKAAERTFAFVSLSATTRAVGVNLLTGAVVSTNGSPSNVLVEDAGNGWWRVSFSGAATALQDHYVYSSLDGIWGNRLYAGETGKGILIWGNQVTLGTRLEPYVRTTSAAATRPADNTTIPDWQAFVERYSLLDGLTVSGTLNIDRLSAANDRTIFQAGSANEFARLDFTTGNRVRMRLIKGTSPAALFTGSQQGVWYDFSDLSTMFQDAAGTVPVTAPGQPVGRVLDKSGNGNHATQSTDARRPIYQIDANGKPGLQFDGSTSNRFLVTGNINFSASDKMLVSAGVRKLSDDAAGTVAELSPNASTNNSAWLLRAPRLATPSFGWFSGGTSLADNNVLGFAAPISAVLVGLGDISGDLAPLRVNGNVFANTADQGTGNYGNYPLYIGRRGGSSLPFNGFIHQLVIRGGAWPSEAELLQLEEWIGIRSGVEVGGLTLESGVVSATGLYDISVRFKPGDYALTVSGGVTGASNSNATALPDAIRTEPAYVGRDIAGSLHWNGNIPSFKIGKAG